MKVHSCTKKKLSNHISLVPVFANRKKRSESHTFQISKDRDRAGVIEISYGNVVRDFESEAKTR